jgi:ribosomal-protein-alanine N-acetyltransferase
MAEHREEAEIQIRRIERGEQVHQCARFMATSEPWLTLRRSYQEDVEMLNDPGREVYVALVGGELAGFIIMQMHGSFIGYTQTVGVLPDWQNRGIGSRLMVFAEERIFRETPNAFICASSFNPGAQRLYQRLGYVVVGELKNYIVRGHSEIPHRKTVAPLSEYK